jgi:hypothetical protein
MTSRGPSAARWGATAVVIVALMLAGIGRIVMADASVISLAGDAWPICHGGAGAAPRHGHPASEHDCCGDCALSAPVTVPAAPELSEPLRVALTLRLDPSPTAIPQRQRTWTPSQARAPPVA